MHLSSLMTNLRLNVTCIANSIICITRYMTHLGVSHDTWHTWAYHTIHDTPGRILWMTVCCIQEIITRYMTHLGVYCEWLYAVYKRLGRLHNDSCWLIRARLKQERQKAREERIRHTNEQIARIKLRQRETEQQQEQWNKLQPYILTAASVTVALLGYLVYQYLTWGVANSWLLTVTYCLSELML